ncbi:NF041680 family putative transposase [Streptomyces xiamenensis]|uniref:NF041680 family putative transposase n=1 Tax=Streptomyces xiamenensis TaxID=408015 RepID=UPI0036E05A08
MSLLHDAVRVESLTVLSRFRTDFYDCLTARADPLFELTDAVLCTDGPVRSLVDLALAPEHRRGHGALYAGLNRGRLDVTRLRRVLARVPLPRAADGRLVLAVDVSPWLRPDAGTVPDRSFCHTYGRGNAKHQMMPGWPYSVVVALGSGRTSWSAFLDAARLAPGADLAAVTAGQVREVVERLVAAGQWAAGDPEILVVLDAGYDAPHIAYLLSGLPVEILGRTRSDRVMRRPAPSREEFLLAHPKGGRPPKHGGEFVFGDPATWGPEQAVTVTDTRLCGKATAQAWDRLHPRLTQRAAWLEHDGPLPVIEGTVIHLAVEHLPSGGVNKPVRPWWSRTGATEADDRPVLAGVPATLRHRAHLPHAQADPRLDEAPTSRLGRRHRWTWLVIAAHPQLRLARPLATDLRRPWERPAPLHKLTPARVRRGFRNLRTTTGTPAGAPKPTTPGPGRPPGSKNRRPATRHDVGRILATGTAYQRPTHHKTGTKPRRTS